MPRPSLENGPTAIVPIRTPKLLKSLLEAWLEPGETISELTRKLWAEEATRRAAMRDPNQCTKSAPTGQQNGAQNRVNRLDR